MIRIRPIRMILKTRGSDGLPKQLQAEQAKLLAQAEANASRERIVKIILVGSGVLVVGRILVAAISAKKNKRSGINGGMSKPSKSKKKSAADEFSMGWL